MTEHRLGAAPRLLGLVAIAFMALAGCGPTASPAPTVAPATTPAPLTPGLTAEPTLTTTGQPTPQPTSVATDAPATPPLQSPDGVFAELLPHVPEAIRDSCQPSEPLEPVIAVVSCSVGDGEVTVDYSKYPDLDSMYAAYNAVVGIQEIDTDSGLCFTSPGGTSSATIGRWPAEHTYTVDGLMAGRYLCADPPPGLPSINWTDDRLMILGVTSAGPAFVDRLVTFWVNDAGPVQ